MLISIETPKAQISPLVLNLKRTIIATLFIKMVINIFVESAKKDIHSIKLKNAN